MMKTVLFCITLVFITNVLLCQDAGMALQFDGDNDKVMTPVDINPAVVPNLTMSAWVYPTDYGGGGHGGHSNRRQVLTHDNGGYDRALLIENSNWGVFTGSNCWNATSIDLNTWQHIAVVYSTSNIKFYKNGVEYSYGSAGTCGHSDNPLWIGDNPDFDEDFPGIIDEVRIWETALDQSTIQTWMNKSINNTHPDWSNLLAYWEFNEGSGQVVTDSSPHTNSGYLGSDSTGYDDEDPAWVVSTAPINDDIIDPPSQLNITATQDSVFLQWNSVPEATSYSVYSATDPYEQPINWILEASGIADTTWTETNSIQKSFYFVRSVQ